MKNKKGFTIMEIVVVIVILVVIAGLFSVNMVKTLNKNKDEEREILYSTVKSAADAYVSANPEVIERLYNGYGYADLKVGDLKSAGLISADLKDPETGELLDDNAVVRAKLDNTSTAKDVVTFTYPVSTEELNSISYRLDATTLYVDYSELTTSSQWCNDESKTHKEIQMLDDQDAGNIYTGSIDAFNINVVSCNVNPQSSGTYNIKYTYTDIATHEEKTYTRVVYVKAADDDVMSFEVVINEGATIALNATSVPVVIKEKSGSTVNETITNIVKDGSTYKIENTKYSIDGFKTDTAGTFEVTMSSMKVNSDGSKPAAVKVAYSVNDDIITIAKETDDCTPTYPNSSTCYYKGNQDNNYVKLGKTGPVFRIYYMDGNNIKVIYDGNDKTASYVLISYCRPTSCCNSGRQMYYKLDGTTSIDLYNKTQSEEYTKGTMDAFLNSFYRKLNPKYITTIYAGARYSNISLLTLAEYERIALDSDGNYTLNYINKNLDRRAAWLYTNASNTSNAKGHRAIYNYVITSTGISTSGAEVASNNKKSYAISPSHIVKPILQLRKPKISGGLGTQSDPWIIE